MQCADIRVKRLPNFPVATELFVASAGNVGVDLFSAEDVVLRPGERILIQTGLSFDIPEGVEMQVRPRSGLAIRCGLTIINSPGTIDPSYRGQVGIIALNTEPVVLPSHYAMLLEFCRDGNQDGMEQLLDEYLMATAQRTIIIRRGERFAQAVFAQYVIPTMLFTETLSETVRGTEGYGSSGVSP